MAQRGIREYDAKRMLATELPRLDQALGAYRGQVALYTPQTNADQLLASEPWLGTEKLVVKPDQLFGKRGKHGLVLLNADWTTAKNWIQERMNKEVTVGTTTGRLTHFLIEPFTPHDPETDEFYVAISAEREQDKLFFSLKGGIHVEENWDQVVSFSIPILGGLSRATLEAEPKLAKLGAHKESVIRFLLALYKFYGDNGFGYLEINPFVVRADGGVVPLDLVAKVDDTAAFDCRKVWGELEFPTAFGVTHTKEEEYITHLDSLSGASLKLTVLNPKGRVWPMVAGGGASVIFADTICDLGHSAELAVYGEYSGDPSTELTYQYAKTLIDLMTREADPRGKVLLIGGGIANFTDVAKTFTGIIQALTEAREKLLQNKVRIYVRRGGPNYKEGLAKMRALGESLGLPIEVYGPETHMTKIVSMALQA